MVVLENERLKVTIAKKGAELQSVFHKAEQFDYIWQGAEGFWSKQSPNLFPIVGRLIDNKHMKDGQIYEMNQHGFARDNDFELVEQTAESASFVLVENDETLARYPYAFQLKLTYTLIENAVTVLFEVENRSDETMPYSLGGHPAFNLPLNGEGRFEDYELHFNNNTLTDFEYHEMNPAPYVSGIKRPLTAVKDGKMQVDRELFGAGLIIDGQDGALQKASLVSNQTEHSVTIFMNDFPYLCVWTEEGVEAPFLCVEPFHGMADQHGEIGELANKRGIQLLEAGQKNSHSYQMVFDYQSEVQLTNREGESSLHHVSEAGLDHLRQQLIDQTQAEFEINGTTYLKADLTHVAMENWTISFDSK